MKVFKGVAEKWLCTANSFTLKGTKQLKTNLCLSHHTKNTTSQKGVKPVMLVENQPVGNPSVNSA